MGYVICRHLGGVPIPLTYLIGLDRSDAYDDLATYRRSPSYHHPRP